MTRLRSCATSRAQAIARKRYAFAVTEWVARANRLNDRVQSLEDDVVQRDHGQDEYDDHA